MLRFATLLPLLIGVNVNAHADVYASLGVGYGNAKLALGEPYNGVIDDRSIMYGIDGGFSLGDRWAIEAGINGFGGFKGRATPCVAGQVCPQVVQPTSSNDVTVVKLAVVPGVELGAVRVFGKAGIYRASIDTNIGLPDNEFRERGVLLGAGARWYFRDPWSISLEAERFDDKVHQLRLGIGWGLRGAAATD